MSHTSTYDMIITNVEKFISIAQECGLMVRMTEVGHLYGSNCVYDAVCEVKLKGWGYPIVLDKNGRIHYDHFASDYNSFERLGELVQLYNQSVIIADAYYHCDNAYQNRLPDGTIEIVMEYN